MASVLSYLRELNIVTMMLRILLAVLCGGLIGLERERKTAPPAFAPICSRRSARRSPCC